MIRSVHLTHRFEKQLEAMRRSEKMAVSASRKADAIITRLLEDDSRPLCKAGKLSNYGESRIQNAIKYDIGKGYRMLGVKKGEGLYLVFVGSHDHCSAWIENNRGLEKPSELKRIRTLKVAHAPTREPPSTNPPIEKYDPLTAHITQEELSMVFCGIRKASHA